MISPVEEDPDLIDGHAPNNVLAYHLHGHVGWLCMNGERVDRGGCDGNGSYKDDARAHLDPEHAVIGLPGTGKRGYPTSSSESYGTMR